MNIANKLTLSRIILIPFVLLFLLPFPWAEDSAFSGFVLSAPGRWIATVLFAVAALTDLLDGRLARKRGLVSDLGKLLDPIADKILVVSVFMAFVELGRIYTFVVVIILARELIVTGIRQIAAGKGRIIAASPFGKAKTATQMTTLVVLLLEPIAVTAMDPAQPFLGYGAPYTLPGDILIGLSAVLTLFSGIDYIVKNKDLFKEET